MTLQFYSKTKATSLIVAFLCLYFTNFSVNAQSVDTQKDRTARVYYSLGDENNVPLTKPVEDFDCTDQIFTTVELNNYTKGKYQLSISWIDPNDDVRENTRYPFQVNSSKRITKLWAWLSLSRAKGAGVLAWINPAAGLEEFIGQWKVEVRVDNELVNTGNFVVRC